MGREMFGKIFERYMRPLWCSALGYRLRVFFHALIEKIFHYPRLKREFKKRTGYSLCLSNPKTFNEKICWKKVYDRNPILPVAADKYKVRGLLKEILGEREANEVLVPLLFVSDSPESIPFDEFCEDFIVKANHGSGTNIIVRKGKMNKEYLLSECKKWISQPYGALKHEWAYEHIQRKIIVEKLLQDKLGQLPRDYKFHMIHGKCEMIQINEGLFFEKDNRFLTLYTPSWHKIDVFWEFPAAESVDKPEKLDDMLQLAEKLSVPFDYVRVDLYCIDGHIYFGELTNYPTSGMAKVIPVSFDAELGKKWDLKEKYWTKSN